MHKSKNYQHLVLNRKGIIIQSNDQLFHSKMIHHPDAEDIVDFGKNILPQVIDLLEYQKSVTFNCVDSSLKLLPGTYDFIFSKSTRNKETLIDCWIIERTEYYEDIKRFQENYREAALSYAS